MPSKSANRFQARSIVRATLAALILSVSIPQIALAASEAGMWKVDPTKSTYNSGSATLTIYRAAAANSAGSSAIVISGEGVYQLTGAAASDIADLKAVDFAAMTRAGKAVLIGRHPRSYDRCGFECRAGLPESVRTVTFSAVEGAERQIGDMLASDDHR